MKKTTITPEEERFLRGLWDVLMLEASTCLPEYEQTITDILMSQEAHDGMCGELLQAAADALHVKLQQAWQTYAASDPAYNTLISDYLMKSRKTLRLPLLYLVLDTMSAFQIDMQHPLREDASYRALVKMAHTFKNLPRDTATRLWQDVVILAVKGPAVYCYDRELQIFYSLTPDDNYYHYGSYDLFGHTLQEMTALLPGVRLADYPVRADLPPRYRCGSLDHLEEISGRVKGVYG